MIKIIKVPISAGELIDKITILEIKSLYISDEDKNKIILKELEILNKEFDKIKSLSKVKLKELSNLKRYLYDINEKLWEIEDRLRELESKKDFRNEFIKLARNVYLTNDVRSDIKNKINTITKSQFRDIKHYSSYK